VFTYVCDDVHVYIFIYIYLYIYIYLNIYLYICIYIYIGEARIEWSTDEAAEMKATEKEDSESFDNDEIKI
jgi:hypothetical protein